MSTVIETPKIGQGKAGPGRPKGLANRTTALLKDALLLAATQAGGGGQNGLTKFLLEQAQKPNNAPFMAMLSKVLPLQVSADADGGVLVVEILKFAHDDGKISASPPLMRLINPPDIG
jgi:hypothetical protein